MARPLHPLEDCPGGDPRARRLLIPALCAAASRLWGLLPNERLKTAFLARLGPRFLVSVWAIVFDSNGRVLLFRHTHDRAHPWGVPSGRLEAHESPERAVCREFQEEVAGHLRPCRLLGALRERSLPALRLVYLCELELPPVCPGIEVDSWAYFAPDELPKSVRPLQRRAIRLAIAERNRT